MKVSRIITLVAIGLGAAALFTACSKQACPVKVQNKPMQPAMRQLDLDGDFVLYMNTSTVEKRIFDFVDKLVDMAKIEGASVAEMKQVESIATTVTDAFRWSGLLSIDSFSMSMKPVDDEFSRVISMVEYSEDNAQKALWRILASEPSKLKGIRFAPADTVYAANSTVSLNELWKTINEAISIYLPPQASEEFEQQIAMAEMMLGSNVNDLFASLDREILLSIQLSESRTCTLPINGTSITIPEPALLIGFKTKTPQLSQLVMTQLTQAGAPLVETAHGNYTLQTLSFPMPAPFPVSPTLVQTEDYLLIGSTLETVVAALESQAKGTGLIATPLYKKVLAEAPEKTSGIEFLSPRLMQTCLDGVMEVASLSASEQEFKSMETLFGYFRATPMGGYLLKTPTGIYSRSYVDRDVANPGEIVASVGAGYVGMIAAIGIPSFHKARTNAIEKSCRNNLRIIEAAKDQWAMVEGASDGTSVSWADISQYITGGFEAVQCPAGGTITLGELGTAPDCSVHGTLY